MDEFQQLLLFKDKQQNLFLFKNNEEQLFLCEGSEQQLFLYAGSGEQRAGDNGLLHGVDPVPPPEDQVDKKIVPSFSFSDETALEGFTVG